MARFKPKLSPPASSGVQTSGNLNGVYSPDGNQFYLSGANGVTYFSSFTPVRVLGQSATATIASTIGATAPGLADSTMAISPSVAVPYTGASSGRCLHRLPNCQHQCSRHREPH